MGKLFSSPKPPQAQAVTYPVTPVTAQTTAPISANNGSGTPDTSNSTSTPSAQDIQNVASKKGRGISGTVKTSWQGVLQPNQLIPRRNNLLGE